jgi:hypothetical protein
MYANYKFPYAGDPRYQELVQKRMRHGQGPVQKKDIEYAAASQDAQNQLWHQGEGYRNFDRNRALEENARLFSADMDLKRQAFDTEKDELASERSQMDLANMVGLGTVALKGWGAVQEKSKTESVLEELRNFRKLYG